MLYCEYDAPVGKLLLTGNGRSLTGLWMDRKPPADGIPGENDPILRSAVKWLEGYFRGQEDPVTIPLEPEGTDFQKQVWKILLTIPYGQTRSYGSIAKEMAALLGKEKMSAQAVGNAVRSNPISILIPCHRVVGAQGQLTGYAGGLEKKIWLLRREGRVIAGNKVI